jgi:hypothetical protein
MAVYTVNELLVANKLLQSNKLQQPNELLIPSAVPQQATPIFSPTTGSYAGPQSVEINSPGADAIYYTTNGSTPTTVVGISDLNAYGDSITLGFGLPSPTTQNWAAVLAAALGVPYLLNNYAVSGARMCDSGEIPQAYVNAPSSSVASIIIPGANDSADYPTPSNRPILVDGYRAFAAWLALPTAQKITIAGITFVGTWTSASEFGMNGKYSTTTGDTATGAVEGTSVYVSGWVATGNNRTIEVRVDGTLQTTIATTDPLTGTAAAAYPYCYRISGLSSGSHSVEVRLTSTGTGAVSVQWMGGNGTTAQTPYVGIGATLPYNNALTSSYITALNVLTSAMCA